MIYLNQLAQCLSLPKFAQDLSIARIITDSRQLQAGDLFLAIVGEHFDGHNFITQAEQQGAVAVIVSRAVTTTLPVLMVSDTLQALGKIARCYRQQFDLSVIAITGSNGKTTVKEMVAAILSENGNVVATQGNRNNHIGLPLSLLSINSQHQYAVMEMGANHQGEIKYLSQLAKPTVAVITHAGQAHLQGFGSLEGVAKGKGEIFLGLVPNGIAVLNADDKFYDDWLALTQAYRRLSFGINANADVKAIAETITTKLAHLQVMTQFQLQTPQGEIEIQLNLAGLHNVYNALAASAVALAHNLSLCQIQQGLAKMQAVKGRLQVVPAKNNALLIDDSYNANPTSTRMAIDILAKAEGQTIFVLGDLAELGQDAEILHQQLGSYAKQQGIRQLLAVGQLSQLAVTAFGTNAQHFQQQSQLIAYLLKQLNDQQVILVKGSRSQQMERVVQALSF